MRAPALLRSAAALGLRALAAPVWRRAATAAPCFVCMCAGGSGGGIAGAACAAGSPRPMLARRHRLTRNWRGATEVQAREQ